MIELDAAPAFGEEHNHYRAMATPQSPRRERGGRGEGIRFELTQVEQVALTQLEARYWLIPSVSKG